MSDANSDSQTSAANQTVVSTSPLVSFDNDGASVAATAESGDGFALATVSEWAFAAVETRGSGEAIDALRNSQEAEVSPIIAAPVIAAATMMIAAETDMFADQTDALVAMAPSDGESPAGQIAMADEATSAMWNADDTAVGAGHAIEFGDGEHMLAVGDIGPHGFSLDWTDLGPISLG